MAAAAKGKIEEHAAFCIEREKKRDEQIETIMNSIASINRKGWAQVWSALVCALTIIGFILAQAVHFKISVG